MTSTVTAEEKPPFHEGEKVLAFHGPMIYEAKVQEVDFIEGEWKFLLHYNGWNKKWDEWVDVDRLLKDTPENVAMKEKLAAESSIEKKRNRGSNGTGTQTSAMASPPPSSGLGHARDSSEKGKRRKIESGAEASVTSSKSPQEPKVAGGDQESLIKIPIPPSLKKQLVDDWRSITEDGRMVKLPRKPTVREVLDRYLESKTKKESSNDDTNAAEVSLGLRLYFDRALPAILLYKQERMYYQEMFPEGSTQPPSEVYGAEHLLRLFLKLPELLSYIDMEEETLQLLLQEMGELIQYLQSNQSSFFLQIYDGPAVEGSAGSAKGDGNKEKQ